MGSFRQWLLQSAREEAERHFNPDTLLCLIPRESAWYAITLLESRKREDGDLADRILTALNPEGGTHTPATLYVMYRKYKRRVSAAARERLLEAMRHNLPISAVVCYSDGNVNHPLAAYAHLICAGELLDIPAYVQLGRRRLREFQHTITARRHKQHRQAEMAEYNSPTYTALTLWFLAIIAEYANDPESRQRALELEAGLWLNVAMHYHPPTQQFAGPFSRAYAEDSLGGFSGLHCTFAFGLRRRLFIEPELPRRFHHPSALIQNAFVALLPFHVPPEARKIAFNKPYPYAFRMTTYCEQYHENGMLQSGPTRHPVFDDEVYPGGWGDLTTYLTAEGCLGTASRPYVNAGQSDSFSLRWRRSGRIRSLKDFRGAYTRMVFNDALPGQDNLCHVTGGPITRDYLYEEGRALTYQHNNLALIAYAAKRAGYRAVRNLRLDIIFSCFAAFDHVRVQGREIDRFPYDCAPESRIVIADSNTLLAILPLPAVGRAGQLPAQRLWQQQDHFLISLFNYDGPPKDFSREQMSETTNGFAFVLSSRSHYSTLQGFVDAVAAANLEVHWKEPGCQDIHFGFAGNMMRLHVDHRSERIIQRTWNGRRDETDYYEIKRVPGEDPALFPATSINPWRDYP